MGRLFLVIQPEKGGNQIFQKLLREKYNHYYWGSSGLVIALSDWRTLAGRNSLFFEQILIILFLVCSHDKNKY
jgi:hypothetical protein